MAISVPHNYCTLPPASETLLSLRKCSCSSGCKTNACGYVKNKLVCTDLCQCVDNCKSIEDSRLTTAEDDDYDDCASKKHLLIVQ
jgi:hypothetical protein